MTGSGVYSAGTWRALPVALLRQAGFPLAMLDELRCLDLTPVVDRVLAAGEEVRAATKQLEPWLEAEVPEPGARAKITARLEHGRSLPSRYVRFLSRDPETRVAGDRWILAAGRREEAWKQLADRLVAHLAAARRETIEAFRNEALQEVLLLSNDGQYDYFRTWLEPNAELRPAKARAIVDTLVGYLQRVCTKNETHSHFGPFTPARLTCGSGVSWRQGDAPVRTAFLTYWAAHEIARLASQDPALHDDICPRRRPLALRTSERLDMYRIETADPADFEAWPFTRIEGREIDEDEAWLFDRCDGSTPIKELRRRWLQAHGLERKSNRGFDTVLAGLEQDGLVVVEFEIPSGTRSALTDLRAILSRAKGATTPYLEVLNEFDELLEQFARAAGDARAALLGRAKSRFAEFTGASPSRGQGQMYADRSILFEECRTSLQDLRIGREITDFLTGELTIAYDLTLIGPRLRLQRETAILHQWCLGRYGRTRVPLARLYADFFNGHDELAAACEGVEQELETVAHDIEATLLGRHSPADREIDIDPSTIRRLVGRFRPWPGAVLNPDVMLIAEDTDAIRRGEFRAVIGDCHALRELLTHGSLAPLLLEEHPDLDDLTTAAYRQIAEDDEMLVDVVRAHEDKTYVQLALDMPHLEVVGVSGKARTEVLTPDELYVCVGPSSLELRANGRSERLRLLAAPAGGPSITQDPLAVFAFPRHLDGTGLPFADLVHVPRITCGRVVLAREKWRIPAKRLVPDGRSSDDTAAFLAAQVVRRELRLPDEVFAKLASEPKPVYIDWDSPLLIRQLVRRIGADPGEIELTEVLPGRDQLWLEIDGQRYTSELRLALFSPATHPLSPSNTHA